MNTMPTNKPSMLRDNAGDAKNGLWLQAACHSHAGTPWSLSLPAHRRVLKSRRLVDSIR